MITEQQLSAILSQINPQIIKMLMDEKQINSQEAAIILYKSKLYEALENTKTQLWHLSAPTLYDLLNEELTTGKITFPEEA
jgi:transcriptional regulator CtsR